MSFSKKFRLPIILLFTLLSGSCSSASQKLEPTIPPSPPPEATSPAEEPPDHAEDKAHVLSVSTSGEANAYRFAVEISSPDLGCEQLADWWEVIDEQGNLLYRRILAHSHVAEQPFTRSGGPITINADTTVWVRAHMHPHGYGGGALKGSVASGFQPGELPQGFANGLDQIPPLPQDCAF